MKILVLESSPNRHGSSNMLAGEFIRGAEEAGYRVQVVDVAHADIHPCSGCVACGYEGPCAQLKILVDRFCAFNASLTAGRKKSALIVAAWNSDSWTFDALEAHYNTLVRYLSLQDQGTILGRGCGTPAMTRGSRFMQEAYALGKNLQD